MKKAWSILFGVLGSTFILSAADIYLAGDSTCSYYPDKRAPLTGWGQTLQSLCVDSVHVHNHAVSGTSTVSFRSRKYWDKMLAKVKKGDYVVIQFGHNDSAVKDPKRFSDPATTYRDNLRAFIKEVRAKEANPVLVSSIPFCQFDKKGKFSTRPSLTKYTDAAKIVATEEKVPFVDMQAIGAEKLAAMKQEEAQNLYMILKPGDSPNYPKGRKDITHLQKGGAEMFANWFVEDVKAQKLPIAECFR